MGKNKKKIEFLSITLLVVSLLTAYFVYSYFNKSLDSTIIQTIEENDEINLGGAKDAFSDDEDEKPSCPAGKYLSGGNKCVWCQSPFDNSAVGSTSSSSCYAVVDPGKYMDNGKIKNCPANTYRSGTANVFKGNSNSCSKCPDGFKSEEGAASCYFDCTGLNQSSCNSGPGSTYCDFCNIGGSCKPKGTCPTPAPATPSPTPSPSPTTEPSSPTEAECKEYCSDTGAAYDACVKKCMGGSAISSCDANEYLSDGSCVSCPTKYPYSAAGSDEKNDCYALVLPGYYLNSKGERKLCAVGTYGSSGNTIVYNGQSSSCNSCPDGYTTSSTGKTKSSDCYISVSPGQYIKSSGAKPENCPANTYSTTSGNISNGDTTSCAKCPDGYSSTAGSSVCKISVSAGYYVETAGTKPVVCPVGSYNATAKTVNSDSTSTCVVCPAGYTTSKTGSTSGTDCQITIQAGYYISSPGTQGVACPKGTYTTAAQTIKNGNTTACLACPANYTTAGTGATASSDCNVLSATSVGSCSNGMQVPKNYYCSVPSVLKCGKTAETLGTSIIIGPTSVVCMSVPTDSNSITCGAGTYYSGQGKCEKCPSNYYCPENSYDPRDERAGANSCPENYPYSFAGSASINDCFRYVWPGDYIKTAGAVSTQCPKGTYNDTSLHSVNYGGTTSCKSCPKGYTTSGTGAKSEDECNQSAGAVFISIGNCYDGLLLLKGFYCNVPDDMKCGAEGSALLTTRIQAINPTTITCERATCGQGRYMYGDTCRSCPNGYDYSDYGAMREEGCYLFERAGTYIKSPGGPRVDCPKGTYSPTNYTVVHYGEKTVCRSCPSGFTTNGTGAKSEDDCNVVISDSSKYCSSCGNDVTCLSTCVCPPGSYISGNKCPKCSAGTYSKGGVVYECAKCPVGTESGEGASSCTKQQTSNDSCECDNAWCQIKCSAFDMLDTFEENIINNPCDYVTITAPGELSPGSTFVFGVRYNPSLLDLIQEGKVKNGTCNYNVTVSNNGKSASDSFPIKLGGTRTDDFTPEIGWKFKECTPVTYTISGNYSASGSIQVKTEWSTTKSNQSFGKDEIIPSYPEDADNEGVSYYDASNCKTKGDSKTCDVYIRTMCGVEPKYACYYNSSEKEYCWSTSATSCGSGYKLESSITNRDGCANACYCNSTTCEIRAKKTWSGYTELKDANGNSITNPSLCKKQEQCYISSTTNQYCWAASASACGKNFTLDSTIKSNDDCANVCYCKKNTSECDIRAKKTWEGYEPLKTYSGTYITDVNQCKRYSYCCVDNGYVELSNDVYYEKNKQSKVCKDGYTLLENVSEANCKKPPALAGSCKSSPIIPPEEKEEADECETEVTLEINDGQRCTNNSEENNSFYSITCVKTYASNFDYGSDDSKTTVRELYKGGGIPFKINVATTYNCNYTFYNTVWNDTYNSVLNRIKKIDSNLVSYVKNNNKAGYSDYITNNILKRGVKDASSLYEWWNIIEDLKHIIKDYKEYEPDISGELKTNVTIKTKENGSDTTKKYTFNQIVNDTGKAVRSNITKATLDDGTVVESYIINNDPNTSIGAKARNVILIPKKTCVNRFTDSLVDANDDGTCPANTIDGGYKMYIGYNTDITSGDDTYSMSIKVTGFAQGDSTVINDKCSFKVSEASLIYRPIDVTNPFINSEWKKGVNWVNSLYDFTQIIHDTTWSVPADIKVSLSASDIAEIKESNEKNRSNSPYLGLCDKITEPDTITGKLCAAINK